MHGGVKRFVFVTWSQPLRCTTAAEQPTYQTCFEGDLPRPIPWLFFPKLDVEVCVPLLGWSTNPTLPSCSCADLQVVEEEAACSPDLLDLPSPPPLPRLLRKAERGPVRTCRDL